MKRINILLTFLACCIMTSSAWAVVDHEATAPFSHFGSTLGKTNDCAYRPSADFTYKIEIPCKGVWRFELCDSDETADPFKTWMYISKTECGDGLGVKGRHDNRVGCNAMFSRLNRLLDAGTYYLTIEGDQATDEGTFKLDVFRVDNGNRGGNPCDPPPPPPESCYAFTVIEFNQGLQKGGGAVAADRSDPTKALGEPDKQDLPGGYVSLGFGGDITLAFEYPILNGPGHDIVLWETTFNNEFPTYPEKVWVFGSQDLEIGGWVFLGEAQLDDSLSIPDFLPWIQFIKIIDVSDASSPFFPNTADGYDVDGIECLHGDDPGDNTIPNLCAFVESITSTQGLRENSTAVDANRSNPDAALGVPEQTGAIGTFFSLGYGGTATYKLQFAILPEPGDDIVVYEITNSPYTDDCVNYPEQVLVEVSDFGTDWVSVGTICQTSPVDLSGSGLVFVQYIRLTDISEVGAFVGVGHITDGYDIDGTACPEDVAVLKTYQETLAAYSTDLKAYPNPVENMFNITYNGTELVNDITINVYNVMGQQVISEKIFRNGDDILKTSLDMSDLKSGVYFVVLTSDNHTEKVRVVKH